MKAKITNMAAQSFLNALWGQLNSEQNKTYLFLYNNPGKEVFLHEKDSQVFFSEYEKTIRYEIPKEIPNEHIVEMFTVWEDLSNLEINQEDEENKNEEDEDEDEDEEMKTVDKKNILIWVVIIVLITIWCYFLTKENKEPVTIAKDKYDIITDTEVLVIENINKEMRLQEQLKKDLEESYQKTRNYKKELENSLKQKIELTNKLQ